MQQILVVEESLHQQYLLRKILERAGYSALVAADLPMVRRLRRQYRAEADFVWNPAASLITLTRMRGNGFSLACSLRDMHCGIPVLMGAQFRESDRLWAAARGIEHFLNPCQPAQVFLQALARICSLDGRDGESSHAA